MSEHTYPLPYPDDNFRFTRRLIADVRQVLVDHGYPDVDDEHDRVNLLVALFGFIYGSPEPR